MAKGKRIISTEKKEIAKQMIRRGAHDKEIIGVTGISNRTICGLREVVREEDLRSGFNKIKTNELEIADIVREAIITALSTIVEDIQKIRDAEKKLRVLTLLISLETTIGSSIKDEGNYLIEQINKIKNELK